MADRDIHSYFAPYDSLYAAFINDMKAIQDLNGKAIAVSRR
ncbi:MAG: hypothetical protein ACYDCK_13870 [Thermoplasmatota archaeon]